VIQMIRTVAILDDYTVVKNIPLEQLHEKNVQWFWTDFNKPLKEEMMQLKEFFQFHPLAIEDCINQLQRPKLDYYDDYVFFVIHSLQSNPLKKYEMDIFLGTHFIVTFHMEDSNALNQVWYQITNEKVTGSWSPNYVLYRLIDKTVDEFFPILYELEERINRLEDRRAYKTYENKSIEQLLDQLFRARSELLFLRQTINPMRDLIYRMINSRHLQWMHAKEAYFMDIYDHLIRLTDKIESNREVTSDIRDNYLSVSTHRTNRIMQVLTVITTIFMPLSFLAGIYGMNFSYMPELEWKYGYFIVLSIMFSLGIGMYRLFKRKGWLK
jgi:magnesium transporter